MFKTAANLEIAREKVSAHDGFFSFLPSGRINRFVSVFIIFYNFEDFIKI